MGSIRTFGLIWGSWKYIVWSSSFSSWLVLKYFFPGGALPRKRSDLQYSVIYFRVYFPAWMIFPVKPYSPLLFLQERRHKRRHTQHCTLFICPHQLTCQVSSWADERLSRKSSVRTLFIYRSLKIIFIIIIVIIIITIFINFDYTAPLKMWRTKLFYVTTRQIQ